MNKKLQVFVSSTYTDLIEERQAAVQAILDTGHIPAGMELFKAGKSQMETIRKWIDESDVYMLILGGRYGSIENESGSSYTELEYRYALSKDMPVFAIVLEDSFLFTKAASMGKDNIFEKDNTGKYDTFKNFVKNQIVKFINNVDQISGKIHAQLNDLLNDTDYNLIGWIRADNNSNTLQRTMPSKIGNYTYQELVTIFKNKRFSKNENSINAEDPIWKYRNALEIFIDHYKRFCVGIDDAYNLCNTNFISEHFDTFDNDYYLCEKICPYFIGFGLIYYSSQKQKYRISDNGAFFYSQLEINGELSK